MSRLKSTGGKKRSRLGAAATMATACVCLASLGCVSKTDGRSETSPEAASHDDIPCDPKTVLQNVCQKCHSSPPQNSAPFPLVSYDDTQVVMSGKPVWMYMRTVLQTGVMPLPPVTIAPSDLATLLHWLDDGAPPRSATDVCSTVLVDPPDAGTDAAEAEADTADAGAGTVDAGADADTPEGDDGGALGPDDGVGDDQDADSGDDGQSASNP